MRFLVSSKFFGFDTTTFHTIFLTFLIFEIFFGLAKFFDKSHIMLLTFKNKAQLNI